MYVFVCVCVCVARSSPNYIKDHSIAFDVQNLLFIYVNNVLWKSC